MDDLRLCHYSNSVVINSWKKRDVNRGCKSRLRICERSHLFISVVKDGSVVVYVHELLSWPQTKLRCVITPSCKIQSMQSLKLAHFTIVALPLFSSYSWTHSSSLFVLQLETYLLFSSKLSPFCFLRTFNSLGHFSLNSLRVHSLLYIDCVCIFNISNLCFAISLNKPCQCMFKQLEGWCARFLLHIILKRYLEY